MPDHNTSRSDAVAQGAALPTPHDTLMSPEILPDRRVTFRTNGACRLSEILTRRGIQHTFNETVGGYTWINWRQYLYEFVQLLFRDWSGTLLLLKLKEVDNDPIKFEPWQFG